MLIKKIVGFFKSLKLTVTLLAFAIVLVFVGTIAQADEGLYVAQAHYIKTAIAGLSISIDWLYISDFSGTQYRSCPMVFMFIHFTGISIFWVSHPAHPARRLPALARCCW